MVACNRSVNVMYAKNDEIFSMDNVVRSSMCLIESRSWASEKIC